MLSAINRLFMCFYNPTLLIDVATYAVCVHSSLWILCHWHRDSCINKTE